MTPTETREIVLGLSRERLARATSRLERVARDAGERIHHLKQEKASLEKRLNDLQKLFEQERQNFEQRAALLTSVSSETEERNRAIDELNARVTEQARMLDEQTETISALRSELDTGRTKIEEQRLSEAQWKGELAEWKGKLEQVEERLKKTSDERDALKSNLYDNERVAAQYVMHFTADDRDKAAKAIDSLIDQLSVLEARVAIANEK